MFLGGKERDQWQEITLILEITCFLFYIKSNVFTSKVCPI